MSKIKKTLGVPLLLPHYIPVTHSLPEIVMEYLESAMETLVFDTELH